MYVHSNYLSNTQDKQIIMASRLSRLPPEIHQHIMSYSPTESLGAYAQTHSKLRHVVSPILHERLSALSDGKNFVREHKKSVARGDETYTTKLEDQITEHLHKVLEDARQHNSPKDAIYALKVFGDMSDHYEYPEMEAHEAFKAVVQTWMTDAEQHSIKSTLSELNILVRDVEESEQLVVKTYHKIMRKLRSVIGKLPADRKPILEYSLSQLMTMITTSFV